jgi:hypothetical protein
VGERTPAEFLRTIVGVSGHALPTSDYRLTTKLGDKVKRGKTPDIAGYFIAKLIGHKLAAWSICQVASDGKSPHLSVNSMIFFRARSCCRVGQNRHSKQVDVIPNGAFVQRHHSADKNGLFRLSRRKCDKYLTFLRFG